MKESTPRRGDHINLKRGDRVETLPHTGAFMQGARYGTVASVGRTYIHVRMDKGTPIVRRFRPSSLAIVRDTFPMTVSA